MTITNALTIDVEDYFQVSAFENTIDRSEWDSLEQRVNLNLNRILDLLEQHKTRATFFVLGWVAERYPESIRRLVGQGHELASHGYGHQRVSDLSRQEFRQDLDLSKKILENISGQRVRGYRAPSYSIGQKNIWALEVLAEAGYEYSSSIYPIRHDHYGYPDAPRFVFREEKTGMIEIPITTVSLFNRLFPGGGGGFFRFYPYFVSRWLLDRVNRKDGQSGIFYFHPWEIDPAQPRQQGISAKTRFRHYVNLDKTESRLKSLLQDFRWGTVEQVFLDRSFPVVRLCN
jgi:polysaccharide deacetylase family protein (PEP-CTERM system associated)